MGGHTPVDLSIALLREYEPAEGYHLAFSGGKDSVTLLHLARLAGVRFDAHYNMTTIDPPELLRFMRANFPEVAWERPERPFVQAVREKGLPTRTVRWCCKDYKERGGEGRVVLTGIRAEESRYRAKRGQVEACTRRRGWFVHPLRDWSTADVWQFHAEEALPHCSLYDEGWERIGCIVCPFEARVGRSMARWPQVWELTRKASAVYFERSEAAQSRFADAGAFWAWWLDRYAPYPGITGEDEEAQLCLFSAGMGGEVAEGQAVMAALRDRGGVAAECSE